MVVGRRDEGRGGRSAGHPSETKNIGRPSSSSSSLLPPLPPNPYYLVGAAGNDDVVASLPPPSRRLPTEEKSRASDRRETTGRVRPTTVKRGSHAIFVRDATRYRIIDTYLNDTKLLFVYVCSSYGPPTRPPPADNDHVSHAHTTGSPPT